MPPTELRKHHALARGRKKLKDKKTDFKNEVQSMLDQRGIRYDESLWSQDGCEFLAALTLDEPWQSVLEQWLEAIDNFETKIKQLQRQIEQVAGELAELDLLKSVPDIAAYSGLLIHGEIGEIERFYCANEWVIYGGLDPIVRESRDSRTEGQISKEGNGVFTVDPRSMRPYSRSQCEGPVSQGFLLAIAREAKLAQEAGDSRDSTETARFDLPYAQQQGGV